MKKLTSIILVVLLAFSSLSTVLVNATTPDVTNLTAVYNNATSDFTISGNSTSSTLVFQLYDNSNLVTPKMIKTITVTANAFSATYLRGSLPDGDYTASVKSVGAGAVAVTTQFHMGVVDTQLQDAKDSATSDVTSAFSAYVEATYSPANWDALTAIKDTAIADIAAATVIADIAPISSTAVTDMAAVLTIVEEAIVKNAELTSFNITGSTVVGTIPVGSSDTIYAPTVFVNIPATTTAITAANLVVADAGTVVLYNSIDFAVANVIASQAIDSNSITVFAKVTSQDTTVNKYYKLVFNVVDATTKYAITAPAKFIKVGSNYKATVTIDRVRAVKLADPKLYVVYTFTNGDQSFQTLDISLSDTTTTKDIVVTVGIISVQTFLVDGNVDWSIGSPIFKSNFSDIAQ